jgi:cold shock CspA family protein
VQATVRTFDAATRSGSVLLDDGVELSYDDRAFDAGGLRLLRVGQRVRVTVSGDEHQPGGRRVTFLTVATLPDPF